MLFVNICDGIFMIFTEYFLTKSAKMGLIFTDDLI